jgi:hypothetical protein
LVGGLKDIFVAVEFAEADALDAAVRQHLEALSAILADTDVYSFRDMSLTNRMEGEDV